MKDKGNRDEGIGSASEQAAEREKDRARKTQR